jgi:serine phosphatase RsbU (regulator of sigma subunit)
MKTKIVLSALEVDGDFFQIIPNDDGSAIVALGDVSVKGQKARVNVSMIVGVLRAEAGKTNPAEILSALNHCLVGRMAGEFATGMVFRIDQDGVFTFANAGHLPPYLNGQEYQLDASLPLGLIGSSDYTETILKLGAWRSTRRRHRRTAGGHQPHWRALRY